MRLLHTMIRVGDLHKSLDFYQRALGMHILKQQDYPGGRFTLAFLGYGTSEDVAIELTHNWDIGAYHLGDGFGHIAIGVDDIYTTCEHILGCGGKVVRAPGPMKHGSTVIAFCEDPDGYRIELIEKPLRADTA